MERKLAGPAAATWLKAAAPSMCISWQDQLFTHHIARRVQHAQLARFASSIFILRTVSVESACVNPGSALTHSYHAARDVCSQICYDCGRGLSAVRHAVAGRGTETGFAAERLGVHDADAGGNRNGRALRERLGWDASRFGAAVEALLASGRLVRPAGSRSLALPGLPPSA